MNADFDPEQPDAASDPLLGALRRQLGENFGQAPPPQTWAGIRQRLAPRPWWRRRRLLPALALLLSLSTIVGLLVIPRHHAPATAAHQPATSPRPAAAASPQPALGEPAASTTSSLPTGVTDSSVPASPVPAAPVGPTRPLAANPAAERAGSTSSTSQPADLPQASGASIAARHPASALPATRPVATPGRIAAAVGHTRHNAAPGLATAAGAAPDSARETAGSAAGTARRQRTTLLAARTAKQHKLLATATSRQQRHRMARVPATTPTAAGKPGSHPDRPDHDTGTARTFVSTNESSVRRGQRRPSRRATLPIAQPVAHAESGDALLASAKPALLPARPDGGDLLARHPVPLVLPAVSRPATLTPLPDSSRPQRFFRPWALQLLAGPTLSYRTVPMQVSAATNSLPSLPSVSPSATAGPAYYDYERPALGWGAQVQARRVLTGRWALALGLGYHEYATRLDLQIRQFNDSALLAVHQRDTYRMLTVPVQVSYALGPPRGPLGLALLAGAEPGWYQGGRVTEGSDCSCQQQTFARAADSPYNAWSVALSLGLDLRYRLGGPAGRWQLLVQPTGRYVATPFVRNGVSSYVRRQPYSLGLLAGLAWDWR